jgi:hypothetical protein
MNQIDVWILAAAIALAIIGAIIGNKKKGGFVTGFASFAGGLLIGVNVLPYIKKTSVYEWALSVLGSATSASLFWTLLVSLASALVLFIILILVRKALSSSDKGTLVHFNGCVGGVLLAFALVSTCLVCFTAITLIPSVAGANWAINVEQTLQGSMLLGKEYSIISQTFGL